MRNQKERHTTRARVVNIGTIKRKSGHENNAFVEFTDYKGNPAHGNFAISSSPLYTTIRLNSEVEIEYEDNSLLGGYQVFLLNPELYKRSPTEEEMAPYQRNNRRVLRQSGMAIAALLVTLLLYGITDSGLVFLLLVAATYLIMKYDSKKSQEDHKLFMSWTQQDKGDRKGK